MSETSSPPRTPSVRVGSRTVPEEDIMNHTPAPPGTTSAIVHHSQLKTPNLCIVRTPVAAEKAAPDAEKEEEEPCPICFSPLVSREVHRTRCNHKFHKSCLVKSRAADNEGCPCCRRRMTPGLTPFHAGVLHQRSAMIRRVQAARAAVRQRMQRESEELEDLPTTEGGRSQPSAP